MSFTRVANQMKVWGVGRHVLDVMLALKEPGFDADPLAQSIFRQLVYHLGMMLEKALLDPTVEAGTYAVDGNGPYTSNDKMIEYDLLRHRQAGKTASAACPMFLSSGSDKARVGSSGLQCTVHVLPNNVAWYPACKELGIGNFNGPL